MELMTILSEGEIERFQKKTEEILATVGIRVSHPTVLRLCRAAGAEVDDISGIVRFPPPLLRELLASVPSAYTIAGVDGTEHVIGGNNQFCLAIVTDPWIIDYETQRPRRPCLEDLRRHTIIAQRLDRVVAISRMDFPVTDVEGPTSSLRALEEYLLLQNKHIFALVTTVEDFQRFLDIGRILAQSDDLSKTRLMSVGVAVISPLTVSDSSMELLLGACANNFPVYPTVCPMAGTTGPYSKASTLLLGNAENVAIAALSQVIRRSTPFLYAFGPSVSHMRSGHDMYYTLDKVLWKSAASQLGRSYNMPVAAECGGTMTYRYDQQNGAEGMLFMLAAVTSKANLLTGIGSCYNAIGMSAEMMIIQMAWLDACKYLQQGINTDDLHMGLESIRNVGPGGNYLMDDLTIKFLRSSEFFSHPLFDYSGGFEESESLLTRAHNKVEEMVAGFESPLPDRIQEQLRRYFADQYRKLEA